MLVGVSRPARLAAQAQVSEPARIRGLRRSSMPRTAVLLRLNGLRVSEACGANAQDLGIERGHRTLRIVGKGDRRRGNACRPNY